MGNTLGCVKQPKEQAGEGGHPPLSPKRKAHFRRKKRGKKRTVVAAATEGAADLAAQEPSKGAETVEEEEGLTKLGAAPSQGAGEDLVESLHQGTVSHREEAPPALEPDGVEQGHVVQVRERFQGRLEKIHLVTERSPSSSGAPGDLLEDGTTVIARLLDNPAEQNRKKAASRLVAFQRPTAGNILVPLQREPSTVGQQENGEGTVVVCRSREQSGLEAVATVAKDSCAAYTSEDGNDSLSSATWGASWTAEKGTLSELSTPSPMVDQVGNQAVERPQWLPSSQERPSGKWEEGTGANLPTSQSKSSCSESISSTFRYSSGYGSDSTQPLVKTSGRDKNSALICEDGPVFFQGAEVPKGRVMVKKMKPPAEGGAGVSPFSLSHPDSRNLMALSSTTKVLQASGTVGLEDH
uniref:Uncharacterized protein n=1 Tax=Sphaerodactylus townsendi TaxID=933632 RepID=A0ACB8FQL5_9SAUR